MGTKTWMLVIADADAKQALLAHPELDRERTTALARSLFPRETLTPLEDVDLYHTAPEDDILVIGCFPGVSIIAAIEFGLDYPSKLPQRFIDAGGRGAITLHAMHSVVDWFAYAFWENGRLVRALSLSPDNGIIEDIGARLPFEEPYWSGEHPVFDPEDGEDEDAYPFPMHPLELGQAALFDRFGFYFEFLVVAPALEPESISLMQFRRAKAPWWKVW
jgi:hypothetical protein